MKLLLENWREYLREDTLDTEAYQFFQTADKLLILNEAQATVLYEGLGGAFKEKWEALKGLATKAGVGIKDAVAALKSHNGLLYKIFSLVKWNFDRLWETLSEGLAVYKLVQEAILDGIQNFPGFKQAAAAGKLGAEELDQWLARHPDLKKVGGFAVGGLLMLIWLNMSFTGDFDYDFNNATLVDAFKGKYDISELFLSEDGQRMLMLLATGALLNLSFPWLKAAGKGGRLAVSLLYTLGKQRLAGDKG